MRRYIGHAFAVLILVAASALTACDGHDGIMAAEDEKVEAGFARTAGGSSLRPAQAGGRFGSGQSQGLVTATGGELHLGVSVPLETGERAGRHTLYVPKGALSTPARVTMTAGAADFAHVVLSATSLHPRAAQNDVGALGFRVPLTLCLDGTDAMAGSDISVAWLHENGSIAPLRRVADPDAAHHPHRVCGAVEHFSGYIIAAN